MAEPKLITPADVIKHLDLPADTNITDIIQTAGVSPNSIISHRTEKEYLLLGVTPGEFIKEHTSEVFDFILLQKKFRQVCHDYQDNLVLDTKNKSVEFCSKIIYEVGPEARRVKKSDGDRVWKFKFPYVIGERPVVKTVFVCTFKSSTCVSESTNTTLVLTIKQASLLAMVTFCQLAVLAISLPDPKYLLTPLAGAVFSKDDLPTIIGLLPTSTAAKVITAINSSCQSGGQYIDGSTLNCAYVAVIVSTANMKDKKARYSIISKTVKQYRAADKKYNEGIFKVYASYAHGGIPAEMSPSKMIEVFENMQDTPIKPRAATKSAADTAMTSKV